MNILLYHRNGIIAHLGGIPRISSTLVESFRENGHSVYLLASHYKDEYEYDNAQFFLPTNDLSDSSNVDFACAICESKNIDVLINQSALSLQQCEFVQRVREKSGIKVINVIHNSILLPSFNYAYVKEWSLRRKGLSLIFHLLKFKPVANLIVKRFIKKNQAHYQYIIDTCDRVVLLHQGLLNELQAVVGHSVSNASIIPNCLPYRRIDTNVPKKNIIVWAGRLDFDVKRIDYMLKIWGKIQPKNNEWILNILGSGSQLQTAKEMAKRLKLSNIEFKGQVCADEYYEQAKIVCVTSTHESFSLVTVEGMMNGCVPVLFNSFPAASMIVTNNVNGILVQPFEIDKFADALSELMQNDEIRDNLAKGAYQRAQYFTTHNIYHLWNNLLKEIN